MFSDVHDCKKVRNPLKSGSGKKVIMSLLFPTEGFDHALLAHEIKVYFFRDI